MPITGPDGTPVPIKNVNVLECPGYVKDEEGNTHTIEDTIVPVRIDVDPIGCAFLDESRECTRAATVNALIADRKGQISRRLEELNKLGSVIGPDGLEEQMELTRLLKEPTQTYTNIDCPYTNLSTN